MVSSVVIFYSTLYLVRPAVWKRVRLTIRSCLELKRIFQ